MASIAWASFGLLFLLAYPYDSRLLSPLVLGAAAALLPRDGQRPARLRASFTDIFRIYGFNLILLPVNLAGVLKSIQQAFTGEKIPFARTPKVRNRTAAPGLYVLVPYLIVVFSLLTAWRDYDAPELGQLRLRLVQRRPRTGASAPTSASATPSSTWPWASSTGSLCREGGAGPGGARTTATSVDWASILYHGDRRLDRDLRQDPTGAAGSPIGEVDRSESELRLASGQQRGEALDVVMPVEVGDAEEHGVDAELGEPAQRSRWSAAVPACVRSAYAAAAVRPRSRSTRAQASSRSVPIVGRSRTVIRTVSECRRRVGARARRAAAGPTGRWRRRRGWPRSAGCAAPVPPTMTGTSPTGRG